MICQGNKTYIFLLLF